MSAPFLPRLDGDDVAAIARTLLITDHATGARVAWDPNAEQLHAWRVCGEWRFVFIAKPRQIGMTTAITLDDVLWTATCDAAGHRVRCGIVVDTDEKTRERMKLCADFCEQLGLEAEIGLTRIVFPNGSEIVGMTAGGNRAGASTTFQRLHLSELPFWPDDETYAALMPALSPGGVCVIESTMDTRTPLAARLWRTPNEFEKVFLSVEEHAEYRRDAKGLTAEDEKWLRSEGFTIREAMAWWLWARDTLCGGDTVRTFREFPQLPGHMFQSAAGRWIKIEPKVAKPKKLEDGRTWPRPFEVPGIDGTTFVALIWREPKETSGQIDMWADTSEGKELSSSAIAGTDKRDGGLVCSFDDGSILGDDLARVAGALQELFTVRTEVLGIAQPVVRPRLRIEANGPGQTTVVAARRLGLSFEEYSMTEERRYQQLLEVKRGVEGGRFPEGPERLAVECAGLHRDELGRFVGPKDLLMCIGGCLVMKREAPYVDVHARPIIDDKQRHVSARRLRQERRRRGHRE